MAKGPMSRESLSDKPRGSGSRGGAQRGVDARIRAKRAASYPENIRKRLEAGEDPENVPKRGFVRLGPTATRVLSGQESVSDWDDDEIKRGRRRDKNGGWQGRDPVVVPMALHEEAIKRTFEEAQELFRKGLVPAVKYLTSIVENEDVEDKDKLKAVQMILDRVLGKPVERVEINTEPEPWEDAVVASVVPLAAIETKEVG
jgi:hypothetical protein